VGRAIPSERIRKTEAELGYCLERFAAGPAKPCPSRTPGPTLAADNSLYLRRLLLDHTAHRHHRRHPRVACRERRLEPRNIRSYNPVSLLSITVRKIREIQRITAKPQRNLNRRSEYSLVKNRVRNICIVEISKILLQTQIMGVTQNNPLRSQDHRINIDLRMIDLLLDEQFNLLTGPENTGDVRRDVPQTKSFQQASTVIGNICFPVPNQKP